MVICSKVNSTQAPSHVQSVFNMPAGRLVTDEGRCAHAPRPIVPAREQLATIDARDTPLASARA
jgi:hypothetical protein